MAASSPQTIANDLLKRITDLDNAELGAGFARSAIKKDIESLKKIEPYKAYIIEGVYYTFCEKNKEKAFYSIDNGLRLNSFNTQSLANAGIVYRCWGDIGKSCDLYTKAFSIGRDNQYLVTAINQGFVSGLIEDIYNNLEIDIKNIQNENIFLHIENMHRIYNKVKNKDILFFKDKVFSVLSEFNKDMDSIRVLELEDSSVFVTISIADTSVDELFRMNDMLIDLVTDDLDESPSLLTLNYSFSHSKDHVIKKALGF